PPTWLDATRRQRPTCAGWTCGRDAKIDSLAAGGKGPKAQYRDAMTKSFASANPPRVTGGETSVAFADATHATARRDLRVNNSPFRIEYRLEKRDGRWLITQQEYLR